MVFETFKALFAWVIALRLWPFQYKMGGRQNQRSQSQTRR